MDTFLLEQPSNLPQSKYDVPSFEEAFDPESLKSFYNNQSSPNLFASKFQRDFGFEDDFLVKNFEAISPATTARSHSFMDFFHPHYEDMRHDNSPSANFNLQNHLSPVHSQQGQVARGIKFNFDKEREYDQPQQQQQPQKPQADTSSNLIAMLCEQMKQYYDHPQQETTKNLLQVVKGETEPFMAQRFISLDRETSVSFSEGHASRLEDTILRKLIFKKKIFSIQRGQNTNKDTKAKRKNSDVFKVKRQRAQSLNLPAIQGLLHDETTKMLVEEDKKDKKVKRKGSEAVIGKDEKALKKKLKTEKTEKKDKKEKKDKPKKTEVAAPNELSDDKMIFGNLAI